MTTKSWVALALSTAFVLHAASAPDGKRWWSYVEALADDQMKGRDTGSPEHLKAAQFVAEHFQKAGLAPAGTNGFLQPVKFKAWKIVEPDCRVDLVRDGKAEPLALGEDAYIARGAPPAEFIDAPLVFAGYGLTVPEMNYDDFAGLDVRGKVIVMIGGGPSNIAGPLKAHYQNARERNRFILHAGAIGAVTIQNPNTADVPWSRAALARFQESMELADPALTAPALKIGIVMNPAHAGKWLEGSGHTVDELLTLATAGKPLPHFPLIPSLRAKTKIQQQNFTIVNGKVQGAPSFFGTNPAEIKVGPRKGLRILAREEDLGRQLVKSFTVDQKKTAVISKDAPKEILTEASRKAALNGQPSGLEASQMTAPQRAIFQSLLDEYCQNMTDQIDQTREDQIKKAGDHVYFAWAGGEEPGQGHYYRIQSASFLVEFDDTQDNANHIHSVWRDVNGDFGEDLLKEHYQSSHR